MLSKIKRKIKLRITGKTFILLEIYPAAKPIIVLEIPATPNTPNDKASWIRPQPAPNEAPTISPLVRAK